MKAALCRIPMLALCSQPACDTVKNAQEHCRQSAIVLRPFCFHAECIKSLWLVVATGLQRGNSGIALVQHSMIRPPTGIPACCELCDGVDKWHVSCGIVVMRWKNTMCIRKSYAKVFVFRATITGMYLPCPMSQRGPIHLRYSNRDTSYEYK